MFRGLQGIAHEQQRSQNFAFKNHIERVKGLNRLDRILQMAVIIASANFYEESKARWAANKLIDHLNRKKRFLDFWPIRLACAVVALAMGIALELVVRRESAGQEIEPVVLVAVYSLVAVFTGFVIYGVDKWLLKRLRQRDETWTRAQIAALHFMFENEKCQWPLPDEWSRQYDTRGYAVMFWNCPTATVVRHEKQAENHCIMTNLPRPMTAEQADNLGVAVGADR